MERFKEKECPLRCVLHMQKKNSAADEYIKTCRPLWDKAVEDGKLCSGTVFTYDDQIFVYFECREVFDIDKYVYRWPGQEKPRPFIPMVKEIDMAYSGKLDTDNSPVGDWTAYMVPHFYNWPDGKLYQNGAILVHAEEA